MTDFAHAADLLSNQRPTNVRTNVRSISPIAKFLKAKFPSNTAPTIAFLAGTSPRSIEHILAGRNDFSGKALANLIRSAFGPQIVDLIAGDVDWRSRERRRLSIIDLENELDALTQKREALEREVRRRARR